MFDHEEQEQIDAIKAWWKLYGNAVTGGVILALLAVLGFEGWRYWQQQQRVQASVLFSSLQQAVQADNSEKAREASGLIMEKYPRTAYAPRAALLVAGLNHKMGDDKSAEAQLTWAMEHGSDPAVSASARLQLAALLTDQGKGDDALKLLKEAPAGHPFTGLYADLEGDILASQGKADEAKKSYDSALAALGERSGYRAIVTAKRDALGG